MLTGALPIGLTLGLLAGYFGGKIDSLIMRTGEIAAVFPEFFMVIILMRETWKAEEMVH